jgi:hypothetical protein
VNVDVRFVAEQQADFIGRSIVSGYTTIYMSGEYAPIDFLGFLFGIKNLTDAWYEKWKGCREFPITMYATVQVKW